MDTRRAKYRRLVVGVGLLLGMSAPQPVLAVLAPNVGGYTVDVRTPAALVVKPPIIPLGPQLNTVSPGPTSFKPNIGPHTPPDQTQTTPEPAALVSSMLGTSLASVMVWLRRRKGGAKTPEDSPPGDAAPQGDPGGEMPC